MNAGFGSYSRALWQWNFREKNPHFIPKVEFVKRTKLTKELLSTKYTIIAKKLLNNAYMLIYKCTRSAVSVFVSTSSFRASNYRTKEILWILDEKYNREILSLVLFKSVSLPGNLRQCSYQVRPIHPLLRLLCLLLYMW